MATGALHDTKRRRSAASAKPKKKPKSLLPIASGYGGPIAIQLLETIEPQTLRGAVEAYYLRTNGRWLWSDGESLSPAADRVLDIIASADQHGLRAEVVQADELMRLDEALRWNSKALAATPLDAPERYSYEKLRPVLFGELDARLTAAAMMLARVMDAEEASGEDLAEVMPTKDTVDLWVDELLPWHPQYWRLLNVAMPRYRGLEGARWPKIVLPDGIHHMGKGGRGPQVLRLRERLAAENLITAETAGEAARFDAELRDDLRRFQYTRGLPTHGLLDQETVDALNERPGTLVRAIRRAMAAWRKSPTRYESTYVEVNLPEYEVRYFRDRRRALKTAAVIGYAFESGGGRTPRFHEQIDRITLNPSWTPSDEALRGLHRRENKQPGYLKRHGFTWFDRPDGRRGLYQHPGPHNTLGRVRIGFPNENNIYLHGTPDRDVFRESTRAKSRGCVRVEHIETLATQLLYADGAMTPETVRSILATTHPKTIELATPIPIHFEYRRVVVDDDDTVRFLRNVYRL